MRFFVALASLSLSLLSCSSGGGGGAGGAGGSGGACGGLSTCFELCVCSTGETQLCTQACQSNQCTAPSCGGCQGCTETCLCTNGGDQLLCQQACGGGVGGSSGAGGGGGGGTGGSSGSGGSPPACDDGTGWNLGWQAFECQVLDLTNQRRAQGANCGGQSYPPVPPLAAHPLLKQAARGHAQDMGDNDFFSHTNLQGQSSADRIQATGYQGSPVGENIAAGQSSPAEVVAGWMQSPGHCQNIMQDGYVNLGVGYYLAPNSQYEHYWVQNFGGN